MGFPGAVAERADADYAVVGAPLDVSTTFQPGTRFGPERIRRFARTFDDYDRRTDHHFSDCAVHDAGDVRAWDDAVDYLEFLGGSLADLRRDDVTPLLLGGEHTVTAAGVRATDPDTLVVLDAHLDLRDEYDGNPWSHAAVTRRALDGDPDDESLSTVGGTADRAIVLGARTGSEAEWERADRDDVTVVPPEEVTDWSPDFNDESVYLSVDVDGADPSVAPGTGTMEPFGLSAREMRDVVRQVAPHAVGFDAVEVNDRDDGQAAALAGKLLKEFVLSHADG
ncbi:MULTISPECIES: arginase family protein [Halolamina]|uniref:Agmatinase n=1 Tax=Halolamina pelagica TaxID=699431 RepID=A0A1I5Q2F4_9EURY|nr:MULTISPECIES: arginase family protein [Halolamina]NHX35071.1 agmatinase [Halolamina sp. R1-12]SFP40528.1 agmatinase [Halolamina pelagica]